jgi:conjugative transfer signal peptidase TraF
MNALFLAVGGVGLVLIAGSTVHHQPILVWNATASVPVGLYRIVARRPARGSLALVALAEPSRTFLHLRGYLHESLPVLKPVAATRGDVLCRFGNAVYVNGRVVALARNNDHESRPLPRWHGCRRLGNAAVAVISSHPYSFDSRYFGVIDLSAFVGVAIPVWTTACASRGHQKMPRGHDLFFLKACQRTID